jgi:MutS domain I
MPETKTKKPAAKKPVKEVAAEREVRYPNYECFICCGDGTLPNTVPALTAEKAQDMLGWEDEEQYATRVIADKQAQGWDTKKLSELKVEYGDDYLFKDENGKKVRCTNDIGNRELKPHVVETYIQDVLNKRWAPEGPNGEAVIIGRTGIVNSGQHRLIALARAEQRRTGHEKNHWAQYWPSEVTMDTVVFRGASESILTTRTYDNVAPRTLADTLFQDTSLFSKSSRGDRSALTRMAAFAVKFLWERTGAKDNPYAPHITNSEVGDFINRHRRLCLAVSHIKTEDSRTKTVSENGKQRQVSYKAISDKNAFVGAGTAAGLMYLMGASASDGPRDAKGQLLKYAEADPAPTEKALTFGKGARDGRGGETWDKAEDFWRFLAEGHPDFVEVVRAFAVLYGQDGDRKVTLPEKVAVLVQAWNAFRQNKPITPEVVSLEKDYAPKNGVRVYCGNPVLGGIDLGFHREADGGGDDDGGASGGSGDDDAPGDAVPAASGAYEPTEEELEARKEAVRNGQDPDAASEPEAADGDQVQGGDKADQILARSKKLLDKSQQTLQEQIAELRAANPGKVLLFKLASGYRAWGEDASLLSKTMKRPIQSVMGLQKCDLKKEQLTECLHKLLAGGHKVAVCEQVDGERVVKDTEPEAAAV